MKPDGINLLVADRVLLTKVSWNDLRTFGFVSGKTVTIDGRRYRCRLLQVGARENEPNEWDRILDETNESNELWYWANGYFWGLDITEPSPGAVPTRAIRGWGGELASGVMKKLLPGSFMSGCALCSKCCPVAAHRAVGKYLWRGKAFSYHKCPASQSHYSTLSSRLLTGSS